MLILNTAAPLPETFNHKKIDATLHYIRNESEWAYIYMDDRTGLFMCHSSYGEYNYHWSHRGDRTLSEFLNKVADDYFLRKTMGKNSEVFDRHATENEIKREIIRARRQGHHSTPDRQTAKTWWYELENITADSTDDAGHFFTLLADTAVYEHLLGDYEAVPMVYKLNPQGTEFCRMILRPFLQSLLPPVEISTTTEAATEVVRAP